MLIGRKTAYKGDGKVMTYFIFPQLGVSVPLLLGDLLLFNATEPHAISKQCNKRLDVYCISLYLKSAVEQHKKPSYIWKEGDRIQ